MRIFISLLFLIFFTACGSAPASQWRWQRAEAGLPRQLLTLAVAADPANPQRIWAGSYTPPGLAFSEDGGQTWTSREVGQAGNPVFDLLTLPPPPIPPVSGGDAKRGVVWAATRTGLLKSNDGGLTWQLIRDGLPAMPVLALAADGSGRLYAGLDTAGVYAQTAAGSWESLVPTLSLEDAALSANGGGLGDEVASAGVLSLAVSADGRQLYAGTAGQGIFASMDGGRTWLKTYPGAYVPNLALDPANPQIAIASLRDRLVRTQDGGQSWQILPVAWAKDIVVSLLWRADGVLGVGTGQGRLYRSTDQGDSWVEGGDGLARSGVLDLISVEDRLLAAAWTGVYGSDSGGERWTYLTPTLGQPNATSLLSIDSGLWLGTRAGLFRWLADQRRWSPVPADFPPGGITSLAADPSNPRILYAGTSGDGLYRSDDGGVNWRRVPAPGVGVPAVVVDPQNSSRAYMLAAWERVYETRDGAATWQARWEGLGVTTEAISIAVDPRKPYVYVGGDTGLFRSYDGQPWRFVAPTLADQTVSALLAQPAPPDAGGGSVLYIGTTRGMYRSLNNGYTVEGGDEARSWGQGLEDITVTALLADPQRPGFLYAGTAYHGVYVSADWGYTWQPIGPADLSDDVVEAMTWGPGGELFLAATSGVWAGVEE